MIAVTGGAGFIGSNIVRGLNAHGREDILVVDHLEDGTKFRNLVDCEILDYLDREDFVRRLESGAGIGAPLEAIFHEGACTRTTEWDGRYMLRNNYEYSRRLLHYCLEQNVALLYASSAAVYGRGHVCREAREYEAPLNVYGWSKFLFDQQVRRVLPGAPCQIAGFRYFNVYGPRERHKADMASVVFHLDRQMCQGENPRLFAGCDGYGAGEQRRDFIHVDDVVDVNLWFLEHPEQSGLFNVGTGTGRSFNALAKAVLRWHGRGRIEYIPFPEELRGRYQSHTEADLTALRAAGYKQPFLSIEEGVPRYLQWAREHD